MQGEITVTDAVVQLKNLKREEARRMSIIARFYIRATYINSRRNDKQNLQSMEHDSESGATVVQPMKFTLTAFHSQKIQYQKE